MSIKNTSLASSIRSSMLQAERLEPRTMLAGDLAGAFGADAALVADSNTTPVTPQIFGSATFQDHLYFLVDDGIGTYELWKTDGTQDGTELAMNRYANQTTDYYGRTRQMQVVGDSLFFSLQTTSPSGEQPHASGRLELWRTTGPADTVEVVSNFDWNTVEGFIGYYSVEVFDHNGSPLVFAARDGGWGDGIYKELLRLRGDRLHRYFNFGEFDYAEQLVQFGQHYYWVGAKNFNYVLSRTDPTLGRVEVIKSFGRTDFGNSAPGRSCCLVVKDDTLLFSVNDESGSSVWESDGTSEGTVPSEVIEAIDRIQIVSLEDGSTIPRLRSDYEFAPSESILYQSENLYFYYGNDDHRTGELHVIDSATDRRANLGVGLDLLSTLNGVVYVSQGSNVLSVNPEDFSLESAFELPSPISGSSAPVGLTTSSDRLYFVDAETEFLFATDGTTDGTKRLAGGGYLQSYCSDREWCFYYVSNPHAIAVGDQLFAFSDRGLVGIDNAGNDTLLFSLNYPDFQPRTANSHDTLYFINSDENKIYQTDGTVEGSNSFSVAFDIDEALSAHLAYFDGQLFVQTWKHVYLWDGTNLVPVTSGVRPTGIEVVGDQLFAQTGSRGDYLWDGAEFVPYDGVLPSAEEGVRVGDLLFSADEGKLQVSDGTPEGAQILKEFSDPNTQLCCFTGVENLTAAGDRLFFTVDDGIHGNELWVSDGTPEGTELAVDVRPGDMPSYPEELTVWNDHLYFSANDGVHGRELWKLPLAVDELMGDADANGIVDFSDFLVLSRNYGKSVDEGASVGDFNSDGIVDFADFLLLNANLGEQR